MLLSIQFSSSEKQSIIAVKRERREQRSATRRGEPDGNSRGLTLIRHPDHGDEISKSVPDLDEIVVVVVEGDHVLLVEGGGLGKGEESGLV